MSLEGHAEDCDCEACAFFDPKPEPPPPRKLRATVLGAARRCLLLSQVDDASELVQPAAMMGELPATRRTGPGGRPVRITPTFTPKRPRLK